MRKADNLPPSCAVVKKSGTLNFLEPSGPVQACNSTALPLHSNFLWYLVSLIMASHIRAENKLQQYSITYKNSQILLMAIILSSVFLLQVILLY